MREMKKEIEKWKGRKKERKK